jgi:PTS system N-acetylglucosamine-specific IIC component
VSAVDAAPWFTAVGGRANIREAGAASSRIWLRLADPARIDEALLRTLGVRMTARPGGDLVHLLVADGDAIGQALAA